MFASIEARLIAAALAVCLLGAGLWYLYHSGYQAGKNEIQLQWDNDKIKRDEAQKDALIAYANRINQGVAQHDKDQALINKLHDDADGVRIHLPACPGNPVTPGPDPDRAARPLPDRVDQLFAEFQARAGRLITRCDQLNIDAIRANAAAGK